MIAEFWNEISNNNDTRGIKIITGKQVNTQHDTILKNNTSSIDASEVKYVSITPFLKSSLKKLFELNKVVRITVIQIIPGIIFPKSILSVPSIKGKTESIKKKKIRGRKILLRFLK